MVVYAVVCVNGDLNEDVISIYDTEDKAFKHVKDFMAMYNEIGCYLRVSDYTIR